MNGKHPPRKYAACVKPKPMPMINVLNFVLKMIISAIRLAAMTKIKQIILPIPVRVKKAVPKLTSKVIAPKCSIFLTTNRTILPMISVVILAANTCITGIITEVNIPTPYITAAWTAASKPVKTH